MSAQPPPAKKKKTDEYMVSGGEQKLRAAWRVSLSKKMIQSHSVYAILLRTITWLEGLHTQAAASTKPANLTSNLRFTVCSEELSLFRKLLIQMGDPKGSPENRKPTQNPEKTYKAFLAMDFNDQEEFDVKRFTPYATQSLIQR